MRNLIGFIIVMAIAAANVFAECNAADKKALEVFDRAWAAAGQNGDRAALVAIYADDFAGFPGMQAKGPAIEATMATFAQNRINPPTANTTYDHYIISCTPVSATVTHRNTTVSGSGGTTYSRSVHVLENRGGKWQVVSNAGNALDDSAAIWYLEQDWNDANLKRDKAWWEKNWAADFSNISSVTGKLANKTQEIADSINDKGTMELAETTDMNVRVDGNSAVVTGIYRTKGRDDKGVAYDRKIRFTDSWIKRDGRWQVWASQGTPIVN